MSGPDDQKKVPKSIHFLPNIIRIQCILYVKGVNIDTLYSHNMLITATAMAEKTP